MLIQYVWMQRIFPLSQLIDEDGEVVEVIDPGQRNGNSGPDFFNAKVKIGDVVWCGNVEIHDKASNWHTHGHDDDPAYDSIILHVVRVSDTRIKRENGSLIPQLVLPIPEDIDCRYEKYKKSNTWIACAETIGEADRFTLHSWMDACLVRRMERKTERIRRVLERTENDWSTAMYVMIARSLGAGVNSDAMEILAMRTPLRYLMKYKDDEDKMLAMLIGQSGLTEIALKNDKERAEKYKREYSYLKSMFGLETMKIEQWKMSAVRPGNHPWTRIDELSQIICKSAYLFSDFMSERDIKKIRKSLHGISSPHFGNRHLSPMTADSIVINAIVPVMFLYGRMRSDEKMEQNALEMLEALPAEKNHITEGWRKLGIESHTAEESQSLIEMKKEYCDKKDCLRCRMFWSMRK